MSGIKELSQFFIQLCNERAIEYVASITTNGKTTIIKFFKSVFIEVAKIRIGGHKKIVIFIACLRLDKDTLENSVVPNRADLESEGI